MWWKRIVLAAAGVLAMAGCAKVAKKEGEPPAPVEARRPVSPPMPWPRGWPTPMPGGRWLMSPAVFAALDSDGDGTLSAKEIANAATALESLDKNEDGKIRWDELAPPPPPRWPHGWRTHSFMGRRHRR